MFVTLTVPLSSHIEAKLLQIDLNFVDFNFCSVHWGFQIPTLLIPAAL